MPAGVPESSIYEIALLGQFSEETADALAATIEEMVEPFGLEVGREIAIQRGGIFRPDCRQASVLAYFGGDPNDGLDFGAIFDAAIPVVPLVSALDRFTEETPAALRHINGLALTGPDAMALAAATILECLGLLPRQRRLFLSYRRADSRDAAVQLFEEFSARHFDVFLDTHGVSVAEEFQAILWHRLCASDVLVMLDTPDYFGSRWTAAEFGRALAKCIGVLRLGWPNCTTLPQAQLAQSVSLSIDDFEPGAQRLKSSAVDRACHAVEVARSKSIAIRHANILGELSVAVERLGGSIDSIGPKRTVLVNLPNGSQLRVFPVVNVPNSRTIEAALVGAEADDIAIVYDHLGLHKTFEKHVDWLIAHISGVRLVRSSEIAWQFAAWEVE